MRYRFTISHVPGKDLIIADMLSRAPTSAPTCADQQFHHEGNVFINTVIQGLPASDQQLETIKAQQQQDEICQQIKAYCEKGWPDRSAVPGSVKPYYPMLNEISVQGELLMRGSRIIIPASMRLSILDRIHTGHQGISKCCERARQSVWWPGLVKQLEELVKSCPECYRVQKQHAQPLITSVFPELPW